MVQAILAAIALFTIGFPIWIEVIAFGIIWIQLPLVSDITIVIIWIIACYEMASMPVTPFTYIFWALFVVAVCLYIYGIWSKMKE